MNGEWKFGVIFKCDQAIADEIIQFIETKASLSYRHRCPLRKYLVLLEKEENEIDRERKQLQ